MHNGLFLHEYYVAADNTCERRLSNLLNSLESNYDCSNAGKDLHQLKQELEQLKLMNRTGSSVEMTETISRLENQIHFIETKCDIS